MRALVNHLQLHAGRPAARNNGSTRAAPDDRGLMSWCPMARHIGAIGHDLAGRTIGIM
jgi:hypothetical protein